MATELEKAQEELAKFLVENPHLIPYQKEIDMMLNNSPSQYHILVVIKELLQEKLGELREAMVELQTHLETEHDRLSRKNDS